MISLAHRTVFVHIPKCGGQSVEEAFCADLGLDWDKHRRLLFLFPKPKSNKKLWKGRAHVLAHLTAREYVQHDYLPRALWEDFFTFSTVRNPFKFLESRYFFSEADRFPTFSSFILERIAKGPVTGRFRPQISYLQNASGKILVKHVYTLEGLGDHWKDIRARTGLSADLPHRNKSERAPVEWTDEMRDVVRDVYAEDFQKLGFSLEDGTPRENVIDFG